MDPCLFADSVAPLLLSRMGSQSLGNKQVLLVYCHWMDDCPCLVLCFSGQSSTAIMEMCLSAFHHSSIHSTVHGNQKNNNKKKYLNNNGTPSSVRGGFHSIQLQQQPKTKKGSCAAATQPLLHIHNMGLPLLLLPYDTQRRRARGLMDVHGNPRKNIEMGNWTCLTWASGNITLFRPIHPSTTSSIRYSLSWPPSYLTLCLSPCPM